MINFNYVDIFFFIYELLHFFAANGTVFFNYNFFLAPKTLFTHNYLPTFPINFFSLCLKLIDTIKLFVDIV